MYRSVTHVTVSHKCSHAHNKLFSGHSGPRKIQNKMYVGPLSLSRHDLAVFPWLSHPEVRCRIALVICHRTCRTNAKTARLTPNKVRWGPLSLSRHDPAVFPWLSHPEVRCRIALSHML